jgi:hypothetical protein
MDDASEVEYLIDRELDDIGAKYATALIIGDEAGMADAERRLERVERFLDEHGARNNPTKSGAGRECSASY